MFTKRLWEAASHRTTPASGTSLPRLRRTCYFCNAGSPPQYLIKLHFRNLLCIGTRIVQQPILIGFHCQFCRLLKVYSGDRITLIFQSNQLLSIHRRRW